MKTYENNGTRVFMDLIFIQSEVDDPSIGGLNSLPPEVVGPVVSRLGDCEAIVRSAVLESLLKAGCDEITRGEAMASGPISWSSQVLEVSNDLSQLWYQTMPAMGPLQERLACKGIQYHFHGNEPPSVRRNVGTGAWDTVQLASFAGKCLRL